MPIQELVINPVGRINRRDVPGFMSQEEVRMRQNLYVIGNGENKQNKKMPGSERLTSSVDSGSYTWLSRYYSGNIAKKFGFKNGRIYHVAEDGTETQKLGSLNTGARPVSEIMKVSENNVMYFVDGFNGMYSHDGNIGQEWDKENSVSLNFVYILSHLDRMFGFTEDSEDLYFSKNLDPVNFTDSTDAGLITIGAKRGAKIQAIALLNETLYVIKEDSIFVLEGRQPSEFAVRQVHGVPGTPARFSVRNVENGLIYMDQDYEFREFNGVTTKILSYNMAVGGDLTKDLVALINKEKMENVVSTFHNNLYRCAFTETGKVTNNLEYIFNTINLTDGITRGNNVSCYMVQNKKPDDNELFTGRADNGHIMRQYFGFNWDNDDSSSSMPVILDSRINSGINNARFKRLYANVRVLGADLLSVKTAVDTRLAASDFKSSSFDPQGETKNITNFIRVNNQENVTDRINLPWSSHKGQSLMIRWEQDLRNLDASLISWVLEVIVKEKKRRINVGI